MFLAEQRGFRWKRSSSSPKFIFSFTLWILASPNLHKLSICLFIYSSIHIFCNIVLWLYYIRSIMLVIADKIMLEKLSEKPKESWHSVKPVYRLLSSNQLPFLSWSRSKLLFPGRNRVYWRGLDLGRKTAGTGRHVCVISLFQSQSPKGTITRNISEIASARSHSQL